MTPLVSYVSVQSAASGRALEPRPGRGRCISREAGAVAAERQPNAGSATTRAASSGYADVSAIVRDHEARAGFAQRT